MYLVSWYTWYLVDKSVERESTKIVITSLGVPIDVTFKQRISPIVFNLSIPLFVLPLRSTKKSPSETHTENVNTLRVAFVH